MAGVLTRSLSRVACSLIQKSQLTMQLQQTVAKSYSKLCRPAVLACSSNQKFLAPNIHGKTCRCCVHTEGDQELSQYLAQEIKDEKQSINTLPNINGWDVTKDGTEVKLEKNVGNESLKLSFNMNNCTSAEQTPGEEGEVGEILSEPPFVVEIKKPTGRVMSFECSFLHPEDVGEGMEDVQDDAVCDVFEINSVTLHDGKISDSTYTMFTETMEGQLYDRLMDMLDDRGVGDELMKELRSFCSTYDHHLYINLLSKVKEFVDEK